MQASERFDIALWVWDYFYVRHYPAQGDEAPWAAIERATIRIQQSISYLDPPRPADVRVQHARRVRNSARTALRNIERLSSRPEQWVIDGLVKLEAHSDQLLEELSATARDFVVD